MIYINGFYVNIIIIKFKMLLRNERGFKEQKRKGKVGNEMEASRIQRKSRKNKQQRIREQLMISTSSFFANSMLKKKKWKKIKDRRKKVVFYSACPSLCVKMIK